MGLERLHRALGAEFHQTEGGEVPWSYGELKAEVAAFYQGAALIDFPETGLLQVGGVDRRDFIHNQCTSDVRGLPQGGFLETLFLNSRGQIEFLGSVYQRDQTLWIAAARLQALLERFNRYIVFDQVELSDLSQAYAQLRLQGPAALEVGGRLGQPPAKWSMVEYRGVVLARDEWGLNILVPRDLAEEVFNQLLQAGATPVGRKAYQVWRVEQGVADLPEALGELPQEAGLEARVSYKKGCYLGQEIMARLEARGNTRYQLMGLLGQQPLPPHAEVRREGRKVGRVTTVADSPRLGSVALALLRKELAVGDQVEAGGVSATVSALPLLTPAQRM
ncbi:MULTISPECIES: folate-binding protein YgfZ [unclassified Meiothermus]|uniref:CAF17-like 4Fe-4S cluster assembly/insertion protein YgfZ n=1 Tax=unclassified Meiothermus TaxID=370471 RepID=UPI000D7C5B98|nr:MULTISPECIES: glycine cleavage T C-terminal barrel domain-containing protein [unclassified Meiothermus]PZA06683.1 folate-binding protein [Meiothermus sp. Pnk-1]RYM36609.1 folate-binding protein [Meiothermus sp. PNK-Is4]